MTIHPYTDKEWEDLPHVILTGELDWDPGQLDLTLEDDEHWYDAISDLIPDPFTNLFDEYGDYRHWVEVQSTEVVDSLEDIIDCCTYAAHSLPYDSEHLTHEIVTKPHPTHAYAALSQDTLPSNSEHPTHEIVNKDDPTPVQTTQPCTVMAKEKDCQALHLLFGWLPTDSTKHTFEAMTQYAAHIPMSTILKKHFQSPNPALNVQH